MKVSHILLLAASVLGACDKTLKPIIDTCLLRNKIDVDNCKPSDEACLCKTKYNDLRCYNECPDDEKINGDKASKAAEIEAHCRAANIKTKDLIPTSVPSESQAPPKESGNASKSGDKSSTKGSSSASMLSPIAALSALTYSVFFF